MELKEIIKEHKKKIWLEENEEYYYAHIKENEKYIVIYGYLFRDKILEIPVGDASVDVYNKITRQYENINDDDNDEVFENLIEIDIPEEYKVPEGYNTYGLKL